MFSYKYCEPVVSIWDCWCTARLYEPLTFLAGKSWSSLEFFVSLTKSKIYLKVSTNTILIEVKRKGKGRKHGRQALNLCSFWEKGDIEA